MTATLWIILWVIAAVLVIIRGAYRFKINQTLGHFMSVVYCLVATYGSEALFGCSFMVGVVIMVASYLVIGLPVKYLTEQPSQRTK